MPIARIQLEDGRIGRFEVPEGTTAEQVQAFISQSGTTTPETTAGQEILRPVARAARSGLAGVAGIADLGGIAVEPIRQGLRSALEAAGVDFMGQNTPYTPPSQGVKNLFDAATNNIARPRNDAEKIVDVAGEALAGGGAMKGVQTAGELITGGSNQLLKSLAPQTATDLAAAGGAGAGAEIANQSFPDNPIAPIIGGIVGGVATTKGINAVRQSGDLALLDKAYFNRQAQRSPDSNQGYFNKQSLKILEKNLQASPEKLASLKQQLQQDSNFVLADIGGDETRALTRQVGKYKGGARNDIDKFFTQRDKGAGQRLINIINSKVSGVDKYFGSLDDLTAIRSELAKDQYTKAYDANKTMKLTPSLNKFVQDGRFQTALADARKEGLINIEDPVNSLKTLDNVYRRLRDKAGSYAAKGEKEAASVYGGFAKDFVNRLDQEAPLYAKARNTFAGFSNLLDAQTLAAEYLTKRPEEIKRILKGMTKGEQEAYRIGVRESLEKRILLSGDDADEAAKVFAKPEHRDQLKAILGSEYDDFSTQVRREIRRAKTKFRVLGGSRTDYNTIEDGQFIESATNIIKGGKSAAVNEAINAIADSIKNKYMGINPVNSKILAKALTNNKGGIKAIDDLIARTQSPTEKAQLVKFKQDYGHLAVPVIIGSNQTK